MVCMSEIQPPQPEVQIGQRLPGLITSKQELPEDTEYWEQVIPSAYGALYYAPDQSRDGTIGWVTNHGEYRVTVESGTGTVVDITEQYYHSLPPGNVYVAHYEMGMEAYYQLSSQDS